MMICCVILFIFFFIVVDFKILIWFWYVIWLIWSVLNFCLRCFKFWLLKWYNWLKYWCLIEILSLFVIFLICCNIFDGFLNKLNWLWLLFVVNIIVIFFVYLINFLIIKYLIVEKLWKLLIYILVCFSYFDFGI